MQAFRNRKIAPPSEVVLQKCFLAQEYTCTSPRKRRKRLVNFVWRECMTTKISLLSLLEEAHTHVDQINFEQAREKLKDDHTVFVDVREDSELHEGGKIPGAEHTARGKLEFQIDSDSPFYKEVFDPGKTYIVYCMTGGRAILAAWTMKQMGYEQVYSLAGGFSEWLSKSGDVEPVS